MNMREGLPMGSCQGSNRRGLTLNSKRPGRNMFAQGATMKRISRPRWPTGQPVGEATEHSHQA